MTRVNMYKMVGTRANTFYYTGAEGKKDEIIRTNKAIEKEWMLFVRTWKRA